MTPEHISVGDKIQGRYLVIDSFKGAMGKVFLVNDLENESKNIPQLRIAKTLLPTLKEPKFFSRFLDEVSVWININKQKNAVYAYSVESVAGVPFVFAEYIRRGVLPLSLAEWLHYNLLPIETALCFIVQLLDGLWYNYQCNINFHGDLKPSNILINQDMELKINDWGWAHASNVSVTSIESDFFAKYHGISPYVATEILSTPPRLTRGMDGYAIGVLLGEMLTGQQLSAGSSKEGIEQEISNKNYGLKRSIIKSLARIISELIAHESYNRDNFYDNYGREIADIYTELSGINVLDDSSSIIITPHFPGHCERVDNSMTVINDFKKKVSP